MKEDNYPEILRDLKDVINNILIEKGVSTELSSDISLSASEAIRASWGGMQIYICKGTDYQLTERDKKIWSEFSGKNHHEIISKYDISLQRLYKIIKIQRRIDMQNRQGDLFGE